MYINNNKVLFTLLQFTYFSDYDYFFFFKHMYLFFIEIVVHTKIISFRVMVILSMTWWF